MWTKAMPCDLSHGFCFMFIKEEMSMNWATVMILGLSFVVGYLISDSRRKKKKNRKYKV